jgi:hypothetical protein
VFINTTKSINSSNCLERQSERECASNGDCECEREFDMSLMY